jgi:hypothetical protein
MKKITTSALAELLDAKKSCEFATVWTETKSDLLKTGNPHKDAVKRSHMLVNIGFSYSNAVNNQREREALEADFIAQPRKWGKRKSLKLVEHNGNTYVTMKAEKHHKTAYYSNGVELTKEQVEPFKSAKSKSSTQGVEKEVEPRDFNISSIKKIKLRGELYEVV